MDSVYIVGAVIVLFVAVVMSGLLVAAFMTTRAMRAAAAAQRARVEQLVLEVSALQTSRATLERDLALEHQKASRTLDLERLVQEKSALFEGARDGRVVAERDLARASEALGQTERRLATAAQQFSTLDGEARATRQELAALQATHSTLKETLTQQTKQADEKLGLLAEAKDRMTQEFKVLADELMKQHGKAFADHNKEQIGGMLGPLHTKLGEFQQGLQAAQTDSAKERATLAEQIRALTDTSAKMSSETANLTRALKGDSQAQGAWGEMILSTILERSGLREGEEYVTQDSHTMDDGGRLRPDVIVNLPGGPGKKRMIIDAKVSLTAFEAHVSAANDAERARHLTDHVRSMRSHINALSAKEYSRIGDGALDYVIMFVPIEGALAAALQIDPALTSHAVKQNVTIATPTTLMIVLRTIENLWQVERRNANADEIAKRAGLLYDKFVSFVEDLDGVGKGLNAARTSYDSAFSRLSIGGGNLIGQAQKLKDLGAKTSKTLPSRLLENADVGLLAGDKDGG